MKITKVKQTSVGSIEIVPNSNCSTAIKYLMEATSREILFSRMKEIIANEPFLGKSELIRWADILNEIDLFFEDVTTTVVDHGSLMKIDLIENENLRLDLHIVIDFTMLLFDCTICRSIYNSFERLLCLLESSHVMVVYDVLRLIFLMSRRTRFITQYLTAELRCKLVVRLLSIVESWDGKLRCLKLFDIFRDDFSISTHSPFTFALRNIAFKIDSTLFVDGLSVAEIRDRLSNGKSLSESESCALLSRLRLFDWLRSQESLRNCVSVRLLTTSTIVYICTLFDDSIFNNFLNDRLIEEVADLVVAETIRNDAPGERASNEALRLLISILDKPSRLLIVLEPLGCSFYHGFLPRIIRLCVEQLKKGTLGNEGCISVQYATSLFSLVYHIAGFDGGRNSLGGSGMLEALIKLVASHDVPSQFISLITRAVRIIDVMCLVETRVYFDARSENNALRTIVERLNHEIKCYSSKCSVWKFTGKIAPCHFPRLALIKSLLNFVRRPIQEPRFADDFSRIMVGDLPSALTEIFVSCEYFGASLFHGALLVIIHLVDQEPSLLSVIQERGVTEAILSTIIDKDFPLSRDIFVTLPALFSTLCVNNRGLNELLGTRIFSRFFDILLSTKFLFSINRRKSEINDALSKLHYSLDEFLRQNVLAIPPFMDAVCEALDKLKNWADTYRCILTVSTSDAPALYTDHGDLAAAPPTSAIRSTSRRRGAVNLEASDDDDDEANLPASETLDNIVECANESNLDDARSFVIVDKQPVIPLGDYLLSIGRLLEIIISPSALSETYDAFIGSGAAKKLILLLNLKQSPWAISRSPFPQFVSNIFRNLSNRRSSCKTAIETICDELFVCCDAFVHCKNDFEHVQCSPAGSEPGARPKKKLIEATHQEGESRDEDVVAPTEDHIYTELACIDEKKLLTFPRIDFNVANPLTELEFTSQSTLSNLCAIILYGQLLTSITKVANTHATRLRVSVFNFLDLRDGAYKLLPACARVLRLLAWKMAENNVEVSTRSVGTVAELDGSLLDSDLALPTDSMVGYEVCTNLADELDEAVSVPLAWLERKKAFIAIRRCYKQLSDLFGAIVRLCSSQSARQRRADDAVEAPVSGIFSTSSSRISCALMHECKVALLSNMQRDQPHILSAYRCIWINSLIDFMFDEKKCAIHSMLSAYHHLCIADVLVNMTENLMQNTTVTELHNDANVQFLMSIFTLFERLLNEHRVYDTAFTLNDNVIELKVFEPEYFMNYYRTALFDPLTKFLKYILAGFTADVPKNVNMIRLIEKLLSVFKHLLSGSASKAIETADNKQDRLLSQLDESQVAILVDMGYDRGAAIDALSATSNVSEAAEYLVVTDGLASLREPSSKTRTSLLTVHLESYEKVVGMKGVLQGANLGEYSSMKYPVHAVENLCQAIIPNCLLPVSELKITYLVVHVADLINDVFHLMDNTYIKETLIEEYLVSDVVDLLEKNDALLHTSVAICARLHLSCLLWRNIYVEYLKKCNEHKLNEALVRYLATVLAKCDHKNKKQKITNLPPELFSSIFFWLDAYEKMSSSQCNGALLNKYITNLEWKYMKPDDRNSYTWVPYSPSCSSSLTSALLKGKGEAHLKINSSKHLVNLSALVEEALESRVIRPVTVQGVLISDAKLEDDLKPDKFTDNWQAFLRANLLPTMIKFFTEFHSDQDAVHGALLLLARLTRNYVFARQFVELQGLESVINNPIVYETNDDLLLAIVVRFCIDDEALVETTFEQIIRSAALNGRSIPRIATRWELRRPANSKNFDHILRSFPSVSARDPTLFLSVMKRLARRSNDEFVLVPDIGPKVVHWSLPPAILKVINLMVEHVVRSPFKESEMSQLKLIKILAEIAKSYPSIANHLGETCADGSNSIGRVVSYYFHNCSTLSNRIVGAIKQFIIAVVLNVNTPRVMDSLVLNLVSNFRCAFTNPASSSLKASFICDILNSCRETEKLFVKHKLCAVLANVPKHLNFLEEDAIQAMNHVIRLLDDVLRANNASAVVNSETANEVREARVPTEVGAAADDIEQALDERNGIVQPEIDGGVEDTNMETDESIIEQFDAERMGEAVAESTGSDQDDEDDEGDDEDDDDEEDEDYDRRENADMDVIEDESDDNDHDDEEEDTVLEDLDVTRIDGDGVIHQRMPEDRLLAGLGERIVVDGTNSLAYVVERIHLPMGNMRPDLSSRRTPQNPNPFLARYLQSVSRPVRQLQRNMWIPRIMHRPSRAGVGASEGRGTDNQVRVVIQPRRALIADAVAAAARNYGSHAESLEPYFFDNLLHSVFGRSALQTRIVPSELMRSGHSDVRIDVYCIPTATDRFLQIAEFFDGSSQIFPWIVISAYLNKALDSKGIDSRQDDAEIKVKESAGDNDAQRQEEGVQTRHLPPRSDVGTTRFVADNEALHGEANEIEDGTPVDRGSSLCRTTDGDEEQAHDCSDANFVLQNVLDNEGSTGEVEALSTASLVRLLDPIETDDGESLPAVSHPAVDITQDSSVQLTQIEPVDGAQAETAVSDNAANSVEPYRDVLGGIEVPDGVDASFLAALPSDIREEVLRDHARQQRAQRLVRAAVQPTEGFGEVEGDNSTANVTSEAQAIDPEFLSALPPELQDEVIAQHERSMRLANERQLQSSAPPDAASALTADDAAAVIESLSPSLRAQVLADADESVLEVLPRSVAAEARRLRANLESQHVIRLARLFSPGRLRSATRNGSLGGNVSPLSVGAGAGKTHLAGKTPKDLLDHDSIVIILSLFFGDSSRLHIQRLQRLVRNMCSDVNTCDFIIWCLLAILHQLDVDRDDYEESIGLDASYMDTLTVNYSRTQFERSLSKSTTVYGRTQLERVVKFIAGKNESIDVSIHPSAMTSIAKNVLETLLSIARSFPGHFLPISLRNATDNVSYGNEPTDFENFWEALYEVSRTTSRDEPISPKACLSSAKLSGCALYKLMDYTRSRIVRSNIVLQEKLLQLIYLIIQTLPNDTMDRLPCWHGEGEPCIYEKLMELGAPVAVEEDFDMASPTVEATSNAVQEKQPNQEEATTDAPIEDADGDSSSVVESVCHCHEESCSDVRSKPASDFEFDCPLALQLESIIELLLSGHLVEDGMRYGRMLLLEAIRAFPQVGLEFINSRLTSAVNNLGLKLHGHIDAFIKDLGESSIEGEISSEESSGLPGPDSEEDASTSVQASGSGRSDSCAELRSREVRALTDKFGAQHTFLKALRTIGNLRNCLKCAVKPICVHGTILEDGKLISSLSRLECLWNITSDCLKRLERVGPQAALVLQPTAEAFFIVYASSLCDLNLHVDHPDMAKLIKFTERHRNVINQVLRQGGDAFLESPFAVLLHVPKLLDFDVKRKYFLREIQQSGDRARSENIGIKVRRNHLFSDSFRELFRLRAREWKSRFHVVFEGEEGQDAGGLLREWFSIITREIFNPNYALFLAAPGDRVTYMINKSSYINPEHLDYFKFVGRIIAKAIFEDKQLDCYFTRAFYKHILSIPVRTQDLESEDPEYYKSLEFLLNNPVEEFGTDLTFSSEVQEFGEMKLKELKENGADIPVTDENKEEYVKHVCQMKMKGSINQQLNAFLEGFYEIISKDLISIFDEQELELLISGLPNFDIDDLITNTDYKSYTKTSPQIQWFWKALRSFEDEDRAKFLQFVTGTSKVPLQGFASLEGMNGEQRFSIHLDTRSPDRLPTAHTCFNQLDLPQYESYEKLRRMLLIAVRECNVGFGFA